MGGSLKYILHLFKTFKGSLGPRDPSSRTFSVNHSSCLPDPEPSSPPPPGRRWPVTRLLLPSSVLRLLALAALDAPAALAALAALAARCPFLATPASAPPDPSRRLPGRWTLTLRPSTSAPALPRWAWPDPAPVSAPSSVPSSSATPGTRLSNSSSSPTPFSASPFPRPWGFSVL